MSMITRVRGDTYADVFIITSETTGVAINITGCSFKLTLDSSDTPSSSGSNLYQLVGNITDAPNGKVEFSPGVSQANLVGNFYFDLQMTDAAGKIRTIARDRYKYVQDVTK